MTANRWVSCALAGLLIPQLASAGMPSTSVRLTEMAEIRLENISFFIFGFFLSAFLIRAVWNYLHKEWPALPRLSYKRALGITAIWGLLFVLVLTMISGARELMTPAAWEKDGRTYKVAQDKPVEPSGPALDKLLVPSGATEDDRWRKLDELRYSLWEYAQHHDGQFPEKADSGKFAAELWDVPHPQKFHYVYAGGQRRGGPVRPLAWEPEIFGDKRLVLSTDSQVRSLTSDEIERAIGEGKR